MTCEHHYVDEEVPELAYIEIGGKGQMVTVSSMASCEQCGDMRISVRLEDGTMWLDLGGEQ